MSEPAARRLSAFAAAWAVLFLVAAPAGGPERKLRASSGGSERKLRAPAQNLTVEDILKLPSPAADQRIPYGADPLQFGDLRLPGGRGPHAVVIVIHGGCWLSRFDLTHIGGFSAALAAAGVATWTLEYRRLGNPGGGWPGTFEDVARGAGHLRQIAPKYRLDLKRVVAVGHSAGGHLALWLAGRRRIPKGEPLHSADPLPLSGVVSLAGVTDLRQALDERVCGDAVSRLMGGTPFEAPQRYRSASPIELAPLGVRQRLINGARDKIVPLEFGAAYEAAARKRGDDARLIVIEQAAHFELIVPTTSAWPIVRDTVLSLLAPRRPGS